MKLYLAGGVGEHGRNCFYVYGKQFRFLVDCGKMADSPENPYPFLDSEQIQSLNLVFLTHSHADHTGAIPWLYENGFHGVVAASDETIRQLPFKLQKFFLLEELFPGGSGKYQGLSVNWGRSGHCAGSVWLKFTEEGKTIFFSGDYTENTRVYACDSIRGQKADLAVLDCAYGKSETSYDTECERLTARTKELLRGPSSVLFPVPKYGRGLELLKLFSDCLQDVNYYADSLFLDNLAALNKGSYWYNSVKVNVSVQLYSGQKNGIIFVSDPQLRSVSSQKTAEQVFSLGGKAVMTGTVEKGSYSEAALQQGQMELLRYPVHLNLTQYRKLIEENNFLKTIPYHTPELSSPRLIEL